MTREEAIRRVKAWNLDSDDREVLETLIPELAESEDESLKNKSGYYKAGKFWKASTLWNATKNKIPQRVSNRYILQECTWNIGTLQRFADEVKNVQEVSLDYPIILDMNGNIIDGAHRVVKAYLEGKDIDIVYIGDDEWPEPDYDEEKAVKESEDERIRKAILGLTYIDGIEPILTRCSITAGDIRTYLEKQKEQKTPMSNDLDKEIKRFFDECIEVHEAKIYGVNERVITVDCYELTARHFAEWGEKQKEQKLECSEEDKNMIERIVETIQDYALETGQIDAETGGTKEPLISYINFLWSLCPQQKQAWNEEDEKMLEGTIMWLNDLEKQGEYVEKERDWLKSLRPQSHWKPSEEQMEALKNSAYGAYQNGDGPALRELYEQLEKL